MVFLHITTGISGIISLWCSHKKLLAFKGNFTGKTYSKAIKISMNIISSRKLKFFYSNTYKS